jgi:hypothetical protein
MALNESTNNQAGDRRIKSKIGLSLQWEVQRLACDAIVISPRQLNVTPPPKGETIRMATITQITTIIIQIERLAIWLSVVLRNTFRDWKPSLGFSSYRSNSDASEEGVSEAGVSQPRQDER